MTAGLTQVTVFAVNGSVFVTGADERAHIISRGDHIMRGQATTPEWML